MKTIFQKVIAHDGSKLYNKGEIILVDDVPDQDKPQRGLILTVSVTLVGRYNVRLAMGRKCLVYGERPGVLHFIQWQR